MTIRNFNSLFQPKSVVLIGEELGAKGTRAAVVVTAGVRNELKQAMLAAARPLHAAHPRSQLRGPYAAAKWTQRQLFPSAPRRRPRLRVTVGCAYHGHRRLGARTQYWLFAGCFSGRHGRRRLWRFAGLPCRRYAKPRHPALHGSGHERAEVYVGGPARCPVQASHRRQGGA